MSAGGDAMAAERCDRCGGKASHRYEQHGLSFRLCQTHADKHGPRLHDLGWDAYRVVDVHAQPA